MTSDDRHDGALTVRAMAMRENTWRGLPHWECDEHGLNTLKAEEAVAHAAEFHPRATKTVEKLEAAVAEQKSEE